MHSLAAAIWSKMLTEPQRIGSDVVERRSIRQSQKAISDGRRVHDHDTRHTCCTAILARNVAHGRRPHRCRCGPCYLTCLPLTRPAKPPSIYVACCRLSHDLRKDFREAHVKHRFPPDAAFTWDFYLRTHKPAVVVAEGIQVPLVCRQNKQPTPVSRLRRRKQFSRLQRHANRGRRDPARLAASRGL